MTNVGVVIFGLAAGVGVVAVVGGESFVGIAAAGAVVTVGFGALVIL